MRKVGEGLSRDVFGAWVDLQPDPDALSGAWAAPLPKKGAPRELDVRTIREAKVLDRLQGMSLPFAVPGRAAIVRHAGQPVLVRQFFNGLTLDLRAGHQSKIRPWVEVAQVAAAIHRMRGAEWSDLLTGPSTRRLHAVEEARILDELDVPEAADARAWSNEHLPPDEPSVFLHGDLLGQNIVPQLEGPRAVIDWEYARLGEPAYDLAIVTRGVRKPFQVEGGLVRLLDAYREAGGAAVEPRHVRFFKLCLAARWLREATRSPDEVGILKQAGQKFRVALEQAPGS